MLPINLALIGFGNHAVNHIHHLVENYLDKVNIAAIGDILERDLAAVKERERQLALSNIPHYVIEQKRAEDPNDIDNLESLLREHSELDAAIISTPHTKHYPQVKRCLEAGLHVLVDKPLALSYEQAKELVDLAAHKKLHLVVGSQRRYEGSYLYAKQVIDRGELGKIIHIDFMSSHANDWLQGWHANPQWAGGGVLWGNGWHVVDTIVYLVNKGVVAVDGSLYIPSDIQVEIHASAQVYFKDDLTATVIVNYNTPRNAVYERLQLWGTKGILILERFKPTYDNLQPVVTHQMSDGRLIVPDLSKPIPKAWAPLEAFVNLLTCEPEKDCEKAEDLVLSTGAQSLETVRIIEAIYTSAKNRERVTLIVGDG